MIYVTFLDGTTRQYNRGSAMVQDDSWTKIGTRDPVDSNIVCKLRTCDIARLEWELPCRVWRVAKPKTRRVK